MATIQFQCLSHCELEKQPPHVADFKYSRFMKFSSDVSNGPTNEKHEISVVGVALFGLGRAGSIHLSNLMRNPRVRLLYVVEQDEVKWGQARKLWSFSTTSFLTYDEVDKVMHDPEVTAVFVATPTFTHEDIIMKALDNNKDVFCEKPISQNIDGTVRCYKEAGKKGKVLMCAFNRRFEPTFRSIYERARCGEVGQVLVVKTCSRDSPIPSLNYLKISGGIFHDCGVHDIDLICWVLGEYPTQVSAFAHTHLKEIADLGDADTVVINLKFPSGAMGMIDLCRISAYGYDQRIEVFGEKGMILNENERPNGVHVSTFTGTNRDTIYHSFPSRYAEGYIFEMDHFLDVVLGICDMSVTETETLAVSRVASACEESVKCGQVVTLDWSTNIPPPGPNNLNVGMYGILKHST